MELNKEVICHGDYHSEACSSDELEKDDEEDVPLFFLHSKFTVSFAVPDNCFFAIKLIKLVPKESTE